MMSKNITMQSKGDESKQLNYL